MRISESQQIQRPLYLPFELYKNPAETEEVVQAVILLKVVVQRAV